MKTPRVFLLLTSCLLLAACGVKGPLVLPDKAEQPARTIEPIESPADAAAQEDDPDPGEPVGAAESVTPPTEE